MKILSKFLVLGSGSILASSMALAQEAAGSAAESGSLNKGLIALAAAIVMSLAAFGAASGQGRAASHAVEGIARNPGARGDVFTPLILSLVFMEFQALLGFIIAMLLFGKIG